MSTSRELSPALVAAAAECGQTAGVFGALHPDDYIFWFIHDQPSMKEKTKAPEHYLESGKQTALLLKNLLAGARDTPAPVTRGGPKPVCA